MELGIIVLRLIHVGSAILWAGGSVFVERFVNPSVEEIGPAAAPFMGAMAKRRLTVYFPIVAGLTVLAGTWLYWIDAGGNVVGYLASGGPGTVFGIGGIAAWIGFIVGAIGIGPNIAKMGKAQVAMAASGPTPELQAQLAAARSGLKMAGQIGLAMVAIAIVAMATARYISF